MGTYSRLWNMLTIVFILMIPLIFLSPVSFDRLINYNVTPFVQTSKVTSTIKKSSSLSFDARCLLYDSSDDDDVILIPSDDQQLRSLSQSDLACLYNRYLTSLQTLCQQHLFIGDGSNGGVTYCADHKPPSNGIVYFFENEIPTFGQIIPDLVKKFRFQVIYFYQNKKLPYDDDRYSSIIQYKLSMETNTLSKWMKTFSHHELEVLPLVITDEHYRTIESVLDSEAIEHIRVLTLRLHYPVDKYTVGGLIRILGYLRQLFDKNFRIYWFDKRFQCSSKFRGLNNCYTICLIRRNSSNREGSETDVSSAFTLPGRLTDVSAAFTLPSALTISQLGNETTAELYQIYLSTFQYHCRQMTRIGTTTDGGWEVCLDKQYRPRRPCVVYSFGIESKWSFDEDMSKIWDCSVFSFDPSIGQRNHTHSPGVQFYNIGLGSKDTIAPGPVLQGGRKRPGKWAMRTFHTLLSEFKHLYRRVDVLKMDIESSEWGAIPNMISTGSIKNVAQLLIEFHDDGTAEHLQTIKQLYDSGFRIFWMHRNPNPSCEKHVKNTLIRRFRCVEVYFVNTHL